MSIITLSYIALALFLGYAVAVALSMAATFGITAVSPSFVSKNNRIRRRIQVHAGWGVAGVRDGRGICSGRWSMERLTVAGWSGLVAILVAVLWMNAGRCGSEDLATRLVMSVVSVAGVAVGLCIHLR